jgi:hypothetical protein
MDYNGLAQIEYSRYDSTIGMNSNAEAAISDIKSTLELQRETMSLIASHIGSMGEQFSSGHAAIIDRLNQPKNIIRDANGKIKGVI